MTKDKPLQFSYQYFDELEVWKVVNLARTWLVKPREGPPIWVGFIFHGCMPVPHDSDEKAPRSYLLIRLHPSDTPWLLPCSEERQQCL